jgi:murein DD-endopeptidase MepM/ murein hydrolase activator NlpD
MDRTRRIALGSLGIGIAAVAIAGFAWWHRTPAPPGSVELSPAPATPQPKITTESLPIGRGDTLDVLLGRAGVEPATRMEMIGALQGVFDVRKLRAGTELVLTRLNDALHSIEYAIDPDHRLQLAGGPGSFKAAVIEVPGVIKAVPVCGVLRGSLFESMEDVGERPELALSIAEIFAWDLDFYTDPQEGDQFCALIEKKEYENGQPPTYIRVLAAKYVNAGTTYEGFLFPDENGKPQYYSRDGKSLQAAFLRSPFKFEARISSHFSRRRFHPVLKRYRPHLGTDYAVPAGTPVQAVAAGTVVASTYSGGSGNMVRIRHANGYETYYLHLSRRLVRAGQKVEQGQRIGLVGSTGLSTGPHLDFRISRNGTFINFERMRPPRATQLAASQMQAFAANRDAYSSAIEAALKSANGVLTAQSAGEAPLATVD